MEVVDGSEGNQKKIPLHINTITYYMQLQKSLNIKKIRGGRKKDRVDEMRMIKSFERMAYVGHCPVYMMVFGWWSEK